MLNLVRKNFLISRAKKHLAVGYSYRAGRNFFGRKTIFTQSGGLPFKVRTIDFKRNIIASVLVLTIEKDINRTANVGMAYFDNGYFTNIILSSNHSLQTGIFDNFTHKMQPGSISFLQFISTGSFIHNIELRPGQGALISRAAGTASFLISKDDNNEFSYLKMNSGWLLKLSNWCMAINGTTSNEIHKYVRLGKAGKTRQLGFRPRVRGIAMNPCDHPHGGGEGRNSPPAAHRTPYGKLAKSPTKTKLLHYKKRRKFKVMKKK